MDYEKAYKAALKTATQWIKDGCSDKEKVCLESVFPELRESEDERIRRELVEYLKGDLDDITTDDTDRWINWIEKQKDCFLVPKSHIDPIGEPGIDGMELLEKQKEPHYTKRNALFDKCVENCDPEVMKKVSDEIDEMLQKEQKPSEWSDTDNIGWDEAFACVTKTERAAKDEEELQNAVTAEKWLKEIKFKYCVHPVKQEWSEEDERRRDGIIQWLREYQKKFNPKYDSLSIESIESLIDWLKSLRNRPKLPEVFDSVAFQKGVQEGRRLEREDVKSTIQSRINEILGDAQPAPILRVELQELIKKIEL